MKSVTPLLTLLLFTVCSPREEAFKHRLEHTNKPWNHESFDTSSDKFTFAVFSDLTGGERDSVFDVAVAQINLLRPEFIMNIGDLIEGGVTEEAAWHEQWDQFDDRAEKAIAPIFYAGGNHDLTGEMAQRIWEERYGQSYYHFLYKDVLFMVLDTEDNTPARIREIEAIRNEALQILQSEGRQALMQTEYMRLPERTHGNIGSDQASYFKKAVEENKGVRYAFLFMHKPIWEKENEQHFAEVEAALANTPYTVFYGHTHAYRYLERNGKDYINLGTTGGSQNPRNEKSVDHITLVTVSGNEADVANLLLEGIWDKTGQVVLGGDSLVTKRK